MNMGAPDVNLASRLHDEPRSPSDDDAATTTLSTNRPTTPHSAAAFQEHSTRSPSVENGTTSENGHQGEREDATQRLAKRRKLDDLAPRRSTSRAISPPWKTFAADGPTTIITNDGIRKSTRFNKEGPPSPFSRKRSTRRANKTTYSNAQSRTDNKPNGSRAVAGSEAPPKDRSSRYIPKRSSTNSLRSPARKSERQRNASLAAAAAPSSPELRYSSPVSVKRPPGRPRKITTTQTSDDLNYRTGTPAHRHSYSEKRDSPSKQLLSSPAPRVRLLLRRREPPNRHPHHAPPPPKYPSFTDWLASDDPLEGEEGQRVTLEKATEEAERRMQIVQAAEHGVLSRARCSIFTPDAAEEPPSQYRHWDHVVAHALHFNKLLKEENTFHKRIARILAREAVEHWKEKYKRKTSEEIDQEESDRAMIRYKQLVKDVKESWANAKVEIDKERVARWEEEQLQLGHKAMDDMFNHAQEILGRGLAETSSFMSEDRDSEDEEGEGETGASAATDDEDLDEIMSSSSGSEEGGDNDEDAHLTAEQLQAKYGQIPDLLDQGSGPELELGHREDESAEYSHGERTPESTVDPDSRTEDGDALLKGHTMNVNGFYHDERNDDGIADAIDPATIELEQVDEMLLDSEEDEDSLGLGSEAWSSDDESEGEDHEDETEDEDESRSDSDDGESAGVMGFLAPSEIKKMKDAAKVAIDEAKSHTGLPTVNGVNGHHHIYSHQEAETPADGSIVSLKEQAAQEDVPAGATPSTDVDDATPLSENVLDKPISRSRSRHTSSPPRTEIPSLLRGTLREYQHDGLDWLANLFDSETNGILADEMGLGKTIQTISLLAYIAVHRGIWGPHLVVVPTSVMLNWEMEFKKWCPGFKILTYYGDINERKRKRMGWRTPGRDMYNVIITSYQLILQDAAAFKMRAWQYLILDEAHNIKNFKSQRWQTMLNLRTERRLLLTGTPLQNNIDELWSLLYFLMPAGFAGEGRIAGLEEFTMALKNPTSQILEQGRQQLDAEAQKIVRKLHEVLRPYLLRRLKADVEKQMPAKYEHVVYCKLSKRQRQLYDGFMGRASTRAILSSGNYMSIINCLMSLRKVCNHPDLFETRAIVTSMAMPKSVVAAYEIKNFFIQKRLHEGMEDSQVNLDALGLILASREKTSMLHARRTRQIRATRPLEDLIARQTCHISSASATPVPSIQTVLSSIADRERTAARAKLQTCLELTRMRTQFLPVYGKGLIDHLTMDYQDYTFGARNHSDSANIEGRKGRLGFRAPRVPSLAGEWYKMQISLLQTLVPTLEQRAAALDPLITRFSCVTPAVAAEEVAPLTLSKPGMAMIRSSLAARERDPFHESRVRLSIAFPDKRLLQYDCGKLQRLAILLRELQAGGHRALIFTQMTKVLDILEQFLNIHGHRYLRLDGATKVEQRQILTDRFNNDPRILCFILSSRSGGLGINLTGADTVIFYDLDWNPAMDKQCQDRSHRIGQTRDVHIYKFVSEYTIEANILRKSNQKRLLDDVIIQKGDFTTDYFNKVTWRDAFDDGEAVDEAGAAMDRVLVEKAGLLGDAKIMRSVEDTEDQNAASVAQKEIVDEIHDDQVDFNESSSATPANATTRHASEAAGGEMRDDEAEKRHVDEYMLDWCREEFGSEPYRPPIDRQKRSRKGQDVHRTGRKKKY